MAVGRVSFGYLARRAKHQLHTDGRWHSRRVQHSQGHHRRDLQGRRQLPPPVTKKDIPRPSSRRTESGDAHILTVLNGSPVEIATKPCTTRRAYRPNNTSFLYSALPSPNLRAYLSHIPETLQTRSPSDTQPSHYDMLCRAVSFLLFILVCSMVSPSSFYLVLYVAILSRPLFVLVLSLILFRQFEKFSKHLYPLRFHLPCI